MVELSEAEWKAMEEGARELERLHPFARRLYAFQAGWCAAYEYYEHERVLADRLDATSREIDDTLERAPTIDDEQEA